MSPLLQKVSRNTAGIDYVVGDIHGMYSLLCKTLIEIDFRPKIDRLFSVGDLVDRGPENMQMLRFLQRKPWFYSVIGNHESMMMDYIVPGFGDNGAAWYQNGGGWYNYLSGSDQQELEEILVPWMYETLPYVIELDHPRGPVYISHAMPLPDYTPHTIHQNKEKLLWDRSTINSARGKQQQIRTQKRFDNITYHGHTPLKSILKVGEATWLDTHAYQTNNLTVIAI